MRIKWHGGRAPHQAPPAALTSSSKGSRAAGMAPLGNDRAASPRGMHGRPLCGSLLPPSLLLPSCPEQSSTYSSSFAFM